MDGLLVGEEIQDIISLDFSQDILDTFATSDISRREIKQYRISASN